MVASSTFSQPIAIATLSIGSRAVLLRWFLIFIGLRLFVFAAEAEGPERRPFRIPSGPAERTLRLFVEQSGQPIVYLVDQVHGHRTRAIHGRFPAPEALARMLEDSGLLLRRDPSNGALTVVRAASPPELPPAGPATRSQRSAPAAREDEVVELSAFTVSSPPAERYRAADAISAVRVRAPLLHTASSISVITRDQIDDISPIRLFDVTRYIAGIQDGRGIQFLDRQIIRGFESNGRTVDNFIQTSADNYEEALIDRIEISKGPNAILSPAGVPGGSINVITKSPLFVPRRAVTGIVGSFDAQKLVVDLSGPLDDRRTVAYRAVGVVQDTRRYWARDARLRRKALAPMLTWRLSEKSHLTLKLIGSELWVFREPALVLDPSVTTADAPVLAAGFSPRSRNGIQPWSHVGTRVVDAYALLTTHLSPNVNIRFAINGRHYFEDSTQQFLNTPSLVQRYDPHTGRLTPNHVWTLDPGTGTYTATLSPLVDPAAIPVRGDAQETTQKSVTVQNDVVLSRRSDAASSQTVLGWAFEKSDRRGLLWNGSMPPLNLLAPSRSVTPVWESAVYADHRTRLNSWQIYLNQRLGLLADRLFLTAGIMHYDVDNSFRNAALSDQLNILKDSNQMYVGSVLVKPVDHVSVYYSYSTNSAPTVVNDRPIWRDGQQHEVGLKTEWFSQRLSVNVAWFDITQTNVSVPNPERQTDMTAPEHLLSNQGSHGMEFEVVGGLTPNLSIVAAHTELRMRDRLGRRIRAVADRTSALLLNYRFTEGRWEDLSLNIGFTYTGARVGDTTPIDFTPLGVVTQPSFILRSYTNLDIGASYRWERYQLRVHVNNLLDQADYLQQAGGRVSGTGLSTAPGRNVKVSLTVRF